MSDDDSNYYDDQGDPDINASSGDATGTDDASSYDASSDDASSDDASSDDASSYDASSYDASSYDASSYDASSYDPSSYDSTTDIGAAVIHGSTDQYDPSKDPLLRHDRNDAADRFARYGGEVWNGAEQFADGVHNMGDALGDAVYGAVQGGSSASQYYQRAAEEAEAGLTQGINGVSSMGQGVAGEVDETTDWVLKKAKQVKDVL